MIYSTFQVNIKYKIFLHKTKNNHTPRSESADYLGTIKIK